MFSGIVQAGTKALGGARFSLVNLMPSAFLTIFVASLVASGAYTRPKPSLVHVLDELGKNPGWAVAATFGVFLVAVLLRPFQAALVQLLEGYWRRWAPLEFAADVATERHRRIKHTADMMVLSSWTAPSVSSDLGDVADYARRSRRLERIVARARTKANRYPRPSHGAHGFVDDRLMPTLLGNVLRDGEDNAGHRYGLNMQVVYPRMYPCLSAKLDSAISEQLDMLDTTSALSMAFGIATLLALPLIVRLDWWSFVPFVTVLLSASAYRGAIATARGHTRLLATAFDLHRFDLLSALHYQLPETPADELRINRKLSQFLESHATAAVSMADCQYAHPGAPTVSVALVSEAGPTGPQAAPNGGKATPPAATHEPSKPATDNAVGN
jgi:hypothetical protein